ncbi:Metal-tetracycline/H(+) antiporter [Legionella massiliensis]|uniref:Metal-tetracycline/H(+) antiporter n=1 Tax=Legionella massiliensis TaxID=1034943 RepID=A0A078KUE3_9GAMM|nr:MFS transporter [Legionella massiliensis]CDZ76656.1 Metal-tetracycline/H(+) antiporter [Legionella massiliensis]CEE12394.1 Tetracycline resistance protein, class B [Legionella massiliensis]
MKNSLPFSRSLLALSLMIFFIADIQGGIGPILSIYLRSKLGWDPSQVGMALATTGIAGVLFQIPSGIIVDVIRFKRSLIAFACICIILSCTILLSQTSLYLIIAAQSLVGLASSLIPPSIAAISLGLVGKDLFPKRVSINESIVHTGTVIAIIIIGLLAQLYGHSWIIYGTILFSILSLIPISFINANEINYSAARELPLIQNGIDEAHATPVSFLQLAKSKPILIFFSAVIVFHFTNAAQLPLVGQELAKINPDNDSIFMAGCIILAQIVMVIVAFSLGFIINKIGRKPIFLFAFIFLILRSLLFSITENSFYLLLIQLLDGISAGIFGVVAVIIVSDLASGTGRFNFLLGVLGLCVGIGSSLSNIIAGFITKIYGFHVGFISLSVIATIGLFTYTFALQETRVLSDK